jgi:streptogramin lyase
MAGARQRAQQIVAAAAWLCLCGLASAAPAERLRGKVVSSSDGRAVAGALVTLTLPEGRPGPTATSVFTNDAGEFRLPVGDGELPAAATLTVQKLGHRQVSLEGDATRAVGALPASLVLEPVANIASDVPASAWLGRAPAGDARNITLASCSSCHQLASPRMRAYAAQIEAVRAGPGADAAALEEWRQLVRHEAWRTIVKYMRSLHYAVFPLESATNLDAVDWATAQNADYNFFSDRQGEVAARFLADHFPRSTASLASDAYATGAPLAVDERAVIREFAFPARALVRELVPAPGSPYLWGADVKRNLLVRLDPQRGAVREYPVAFEGATGPHTIAPDDDGALWVSMVDNDQFGRFDPKTERWRLWTLRPSSGLADDASIGGAAIVHDMSIDSRGHMARDADGNVWLTMVGTNQLGTLHPETGRVAFFDTHRIDGLSAINHLLYSVVLSEDRAHVWFSQVNGWVGSLDTRTKRVEKLVPFAEGEGPRRMARDDDGHLWVAKIDMASGRIVAKYDLPDRAAAPYAVTWDARRRVVWVASANSDAIYRLEPASGAVSVLPLPRQMAYLRQLAIDRDGRLIGSYGNYPEGSGPSMGLVIDPGDLRAPR